MACTPGGEARALLLSSLTALVARFSAFSAFCLFLFSVLLAIPFTFFLSGQEKEGREETARNYSTTLGASSAVARSLLSQFANRAPVHGSFICILRFFEVKLTRRLPLPTVTSLRVRILRVFSLSLSLSASFSLSKMRASRFAPARPTDPENYQRPCEISRNVKIDAKSLIIRSITIG